MLYNMSGKSPNWPTGTFGQTSGYIYIFFCFSTSVSYHVVFLYINISLCFFFLHIYIYINAVVLNEVANSTLLPENSCLSFVNMCVNDNTLILQILTFF